MTGAGTALVLGSSGVTGTPFCEQLLAAGWKVYGVSRRRPDLDGKIPQQAFVHLAVDLEDGDAVRDAVRGAPGITHVFHCANAGGDAIRLKIMSNLLDALETLPRFRNINLLQGMKYYGCQRGPFPTPAREIDPRLADSPFYYAEEDLVRTRQAGRAWTWTAIRPHSVCGYAPGNPLNLALVLAVYAALRRERGEPLWFPASSACFASLFQVMDADILARAAIFIASTPACANNAFNVSNGDIFRWRTLWPSFAKFFDLRAEGPGQKPLADFLAANRDTWDALAARCGLRPFPIERAPAWVRGDYRAPDSRFACEYDLISDTVKLRRAGFCEAVGSEEMFLRLFARYRDARLIP